MKIGLVLAGGMAKGALQFGALKALNEFVPLEKIKYISCASVGVLNGYAFATDNLSGGEQIWKNVCAEKEKIIISQMLKSEKLQQYILDLYACKNTPQSTFYCSLLNYSKRSMVYKDLSLVEKEKIRAYLKASVAMPVYNRAVQIDSAAYFDGAMIDNIPVYPLLKHDLDYIICIYFDDTCYKFESTEVDNKIIKVTFPCKNALRQSLVFKKDDIEEMLAQGYEVAKKIFSNVFAQGNENLEYIYSVIKEANKQSKGNMRITGDVLVTNLNKITQKLTDKKVL